MAAGSINNSYRAGNISGGPGRLTMPWVSDAAGVVDITLNEAIQGNVMGASIASDGGGTQPTDLYDVQVLDSLSRDLLAGQGANISNATTKEISPADVNDMPVVTPTVKLSITGAGNAKGGTVTLFYR